MPQTTPERAARWPGGDSQAIEFLEKRGFTLFRDWVWRRPDDRVADEIETDAIRYLIEEWDFGGYDFWETRPDV